MRYLVTGAGGGIGRAVALLAAERDGDCRLALVDREPSSLEETARLAAMAGASVESLVADLATADGPGRVVDDALGALGGLDALISNAGVIRAGALSELALEDFDLTFAVNTRATWLLARAAYPALVESRGAVVVTTSISGHHATPPLGAYSASKAALLMLARQLALEWGPDGIRVNAVAPGPTDSGLTFRAFGDEADPVAVRNRRAREATIPLRRVGAPADVAEAILFLAGPHAVQVTGAELVVDGGATLNLMPATGASSAHGGRVSPTPKT